jgi:hypothetical protein
MAIPHLTAPLETGVEFVAIVGPSFGWNFWNAPTDSC